MLRGLKERLEARIEVAIHQDAQPYPRLQME